MKKVFALIAAIVACPGFIAKKKPECIQINISQLLNARPVTVLYNGKLKTWVKGIDGGGTGDGYLTAAAALANGDSAMHALPDNPVFAANSFHPPIKLHYNNNDAAYYQAFALAGEGQFAFEVPQHKYSGTYLCFTSAEGASQLQFTLTYTDGETTQSFLLPDYYNDVAQNDTICYLAHDLAKWGSDNKMKEASHHNIDIINLHPNASRLLKKITVKKGKGGYLVFWAAAGLR